MTSFGGVGKSLVGTIHGNNFAWASILLYLFNGGGTAHDATDIRLAFGRTTIRMYCTDIDKPTACLLYTSDAADE